MRLLLILAVLAARPTLAQPPVASKLADKPAAATYPPGPDKDGVVRVTLNVSPATEPVPVGRFNIYPEYRDQQPGNRVQGLLRTFMEQDNFFNNKERNEQRQKWLTSPLADLPADVRAQANVGRGMMYDKNTVFLGIADRAARFSRTEWNEFFDLRKDGAFMVLPEVQKLRAVAAPLSLRMRGEIKAGEWERAVETAKTLFGIAQALEQHPTLIGNLVGIAIAQIALNGVEEMVGQPGCPSLYWALVAVPERPVSTRHGLDGERVFLIAQFQPLLDARRPLSDAELAPYLSIIAELMSSADAAQKKTNPQFEEVRTNAAGWFAGTVADPEKKAAAVNRLVGRGVPVAVARSYPATQLGLVNDLLLYEELRDDLFKWYNLPHAQALPGMIAADGVIKSRSKESVVAPLFIATTFKVKSAETRLAQRTMLLRAVEAVRLHAAKGELPATLAAAGVPEAMDPVTGKPFGYTVTDGVATLRGDNPHTGGTPFIVEYTIKLRK